jgi:hypothetical protein
MRNKLPVSLLVLTITAPAFAQRAQPSDPVITVQGSADIRVAPDEATVRLGIVRQANTAQAAQEQANATAQQILSAITRLGVAQQQIQTSRLNLSPIFAPRSPESREAPRIVAYQAANLISIRLDDLAQVGPAIDAGLKAGANQLEGVQFGLRDELPAREQALKQAVNEARRKAEAIAEALNVRLDGVLEVSEGGVSVTPRTEYGDVVMARALEASPTPVSPGQLEVRASVSIRYRIGAVSR